jgi:ribosomal-protein-alanine N-acetyltransferase
MANFRIEKLTKEMVENVFEIEKAFFDVTTNQTILDSFDSDNLFYFVLFLDDEVVGFLEGSIVLDEAELFEIAIKENFQGKKYSLKLMDYFLSYCKEKNVETIFLEVNTINSKAISLYEKYGFEKYFVRKKYYGDNDAILMKLYLK